MSEPVRLWARTFAIKFLHLKMSNGRPTPLILRTSAARRGRTELRRQNRGQFWTANLPALLLQPLARRPECGRGTPRPWPRAKQRGDSRRGRVPCDRAWLRDRRRSAGKAGSRDIAERAV